MMKAPPFRAGKLTFLILLGGLAIPAGILIGIGLFISRRGAPEGDA